LIGSYYAASGRRFNQENSDGKDNDSGFEPHASDEFARGRGTIRLQWRIDIQRRHCFIASGRLFRIIFWIRCSASAAEYFS
jgi:hypothetical protein